MAVERQWATCQESYSLRLLSFLPSLYVAFIYNPNSGPPICRAWQILVQSFEVGMHEFGSCVY